MSAAERKIVHTVLQEHEGVTTASEGEGPDRRVVVEPVR
jgi:predicted RNA-binding protein Jag